MSGTAVKSSNRSINRTYAGPDLQSRQRYYWQVRVWDEHGVPSPYSQASWWEMGLLSPQDWQAKWITRDMPVERGDYESGVQWIWAADDHGDAHATPGRHEFRFHFTLPEAPEEATLFITARDNVAAWVNGKQVLQPSPVFAYGPDTLGGIFAKFRSANFSPQVRTYWLQKHSSAKEIPASPLQQDWLPCCECRTGTKQFCDSYRARNGGLLRSNPAIGLPRISKIPIGPQRPLSDRSGRSRRDLLGRHCQPAFYVVSSISSSQCAPRAFTPLP